jgi:hypothetical protein
VAILRAQHPGAAEVDVPLPGVPVDLVRDPAPRTSDIQEVHRLKLTGVHEGTDLLPSLVDFDIEVPELRALLPDAPSRVQARFDGAYLGGSASPAPIRFNGQISASFDGKAERSGGLATPSFTADAISRERGPVDQKVFDPTTAMDAFSSMKLLGIPITSLLPAAPLPPEIMQTLVEGQPPRVHMAWEDIKLKSDGMFRAHKAGAPPTDTTTLRLRVDQDGAGLATACDLDAFTLALPPGGPDLLVLTFDGLAYRQKAGDAPTVDAKGLDVIFGADLELLKGLQEKLDLGGGPPTVDLRPDGISARYCIVIPDAPAGMFSLTNISVVIGVDIPFRGGTPSITLGFATREDPFQLTVLTFGGGGYVLMRIDERGLSQLEASLDFGATIGVDFGIVSAEVHALGGVRYTMGPGGSPISAAGFIRIGGSVDILGLASVSVDLLVELTYESGGNRLVGRATLVVEIDLTLYSDSFELDSGEWVIAGGSATNAQPITGGPPDDSGSRDAWRRYQEAYA